MISDESEIKDVRLQDSRRSRRPIDLGELRKRQQLLREFQIALEQNDIEYFKRAITDVLGQKPGTPAFEKSLKIWYAFRGEP